MRMGTIVFSVQQSGDCRGAGRTVHTPCIVLIYMIYLTPLFCFFVDGPPTHNPLPPPGPLGSIHNGCVLLCQDTIKPPE